MFINVYKCSIFKKDTEYKKTNSLKSIKFSTFQNKFLLKKKYKTH